MRRSVRTRIDKMKGILECSVGEIKESNFTGLVDGCERGAIARDSKREPVASDHVIFGCFATGPPKDVAVFGAADEVLAIRREGEGPDFAVVTLESGEASTTGEVP